MLLGKRETKKFRFLLSRVTNSLAMFTFPITIGLYMLAPQVIEIISGKGYLRGVSSLRLLCPALLASVFSWVLAYCVLLPAKRENKFFISAVVSAVLNISLNFVLIPLMSENGAAITTTIAELLMLVMIIFYCKDILNGIYNSEFWKDIVSYIVGSIGIIGACLISTELSKTVFVQVLISVVFSALVYALILVICGNSMIYSIVNEIKERIRR
jgi:O-antigen/teichoic acid export membrane protein